MFAYVFYRPVFRSHLWSFSMARKPCFTFFLTLLFDACCEGWGFEKILLRFALTSLVFVASYARLPPGSRFHLKHQHLHVPWQRAIQGFCGYNQALGDVATASGPPLHPHRLLVWEMKLHVQEAAE